MFDAREFLEREFGPPRNVLVLFDSYGLPSPPLGSIQKWYARGSLPGAWLAQLMCVLELEKSQPVALSAYMTNRRKHARRA